MPDLEDLPLDRFCNYVYWSATRNSSQVDIEKFRARIWRPPKGEAADERSPWSEKNETGAFQALKAGLGLGAKTSAS